MAAMSCRSLLESGSTRLTQRVRLLLDAVSEPETEHELQAAQQPSLSGVAKGILGRCCQPSLNVTVVRRLRIAAAPISLPGSVHDREGNGWASARGGTTLSRTG
jgi:hypothetical protein